MKRFQTVIVGTTRLCRSGWLWCVLVGWVLATQWLGDGIDLSQWAQGVEMAGMRSVLTPYVLVEDIVLVTVLSLFFGVLAALYPAWRAVKIKPLEALRR